MRKYIALWHIGEVTRGEVVTLEDKEAKRLLALGAIKPVKSEEPPAAEPRENEPEPETAAETVADAETLPELEISGDMVGEPEPEAPKKKRGKRT